MRYVDRQVGRVFAELKNLGLDKNTVVIVWGDHGWHLGEQQIWAKHTPFERANRSVLMIRAPGIAGPGRKTDALVETIDLYPTLIDLCHPTFQQTHWPLDGTSLVPILQGQASTVREAAVSYWGNAVSIRTATHRLIIGQNKQGPAHTALYDLSTDLDARQNIADSHSGLVQQIRQYLPKEPRTK